MRLSNCSVGATCSIALLFSNGCATFDEAGERVVRDDTVLFNETGDRLVDLNVPMIIRIPTDKSPSIELEFYKVVEVDAIYRTENHREKVLTRMVHPVQIALEKGNAFIEDDPLGNTIPGVLGMSVVFAIAPLSLLFQDAEKQKKYEYIPRSHFYTHQTKIERRTRAAKGMLVTIDEQLIGRTGYNGRITFQKNPTAFNEGVVIEVNEPKKRFNITRTELPSTFQSWRAPARVAIEAGGAASTIAQVSRAISLGAGPGSITVIVLISLVSGIAVGEIIDIAAENEPEFSWSVTAIE